MCLSTTRQLIWIDELHPGNRLLQWDHDFGGGNATDAQLAILTGVGLWKEQTSEELVMLSSPSVDYVLGLRVSPSPHLAVVSLPWSIPVQNQTCSLRSLLPINTLPPLDVTATVAFTLVSQYSDGSVAFVEVSCNTSARAEHPASHWSQSIMQLEEDYKEISLNVTEVAATRYTSLHGRWAWQGKVESI